ncbi:hypothetical protein D3C80_782010 [compost metagenome]
MAEEFAFEQSFRHGRAVDLDEGAVTARAVIVDGRSNHFLSGAAFSRHQDRCIASRYLGYHLQQAQHFRTIGEDAIHAVAGRKLPLKRCDIVAHRPHLERPADE